MHDDGVPETPARATEVGPYEDLDIEALLYDPGEEVRPAPLVVKIHGGPRAADYRTFDLHRGNKASASGLDPEAVHTVAEALDNPQVEAHRMITELEHPEVGTIPVVEHPLKYENAESGFEMPPPLLGEHNREVFRGLGYSEARLDQLEAAGAFGATEGESEE